MPKIKPIIARTPEALAEALGLSASHAKEWQVQYDSQRNLKEITKRRKLTQPRSRRALPSVTE